MQEFPIELSDPDNHPTMISVGRNEQMQAWDLNLFVGNFKTEAAAHRYADIVKEFLEEEAEGKFIARA